MATIMHHAFKSLIRELWDGSVSKVLATQIPELKYESPAPHEKQASWCVYSQSREETKTVPGSPPPANLAESVNSRSSKRLVSKKIRKWRAL